MTVVRIESPAARATRVVTELARDGQSVMRNARLVRVGETPEGWIARFEAGRFDPVAGSFSFVHYPKNVRDARLMAASHLTRAPGGANGFFPGSTGVLIVTRHPKTGALIVEQLQGSFRKGTPKALDWHTAVTYTGFPDRPGFQEHLLRHLFGVFMADDSSNSLYLPLRFRRKGQNWVPAGARNEAVFRSLAREFGLDVTEAHIRRPTAETLPALLVEK